jgi:hypothetical protein
MLAERRKEELEGECLASFLTGADKPNLFHASCQEEVDYMAYVYLRFVSRLTSYVANITACSLELNGTKVE